MIIFNKKISREITDPLVIQTFKKKTDFAANFFGILLFRWYFISITWCAFFKNSCVINCLSNEMSVLNFCRLKKLTASKNVQSIEERKRVCVYRASNKGAMYYHRKYLFLVLNIFNFTYNRNLHYTLKVMCVLSCLQ